MNRRAASSSPAIWTARDLAGDPHASEDKAARVKAMFGAIAGRYDLNNRLHSFGADQRWRRAAVAAAAVGPGDHVLDVACGTGDLTEAFADAGPASVTGVDFTEGMLRIAEGKAARRRRGGHMPVPRYVCGDAMGLEMPDESFDVVSIAFGIRNVSDPDRALAEFHRVLRPGGRLVVLEFAEPANRLIRAVNRFYTTKVMPVTASWLAADRSGAYRYLPRSVATFADKRELARRIESAGFIQVSQRPLTFGVCAVSRALKAPGSPAA